MTLFLHSGLSTSRQERFEFSCCELMVAKTNGQWLNCFLFVVYRSPSTDDRVFDCLCEVMGSIESVDPKEWLRSPITDANGLAVFDFVTVADCSQLVNGPTHRAGGVLF